MTPDIKNLLRKHPAFCVFEDAELDALTQEMTLLSFNMGDTIVEQGSTGDAAFVLFSGRARVLQTNAQGQQITLGTLNGGDIFGERAILRDEPRLATVRAASEVAVFRISRQTFLRQVEKRVELKQHLEKFMHDTGMINFLKLTTFLGTLTPPQISKVITQLEERSYAAGDVVFREGDVGDAMYIVRSGLFEVRRGEGADAVILARLGEGQFFGELAILSNQPRKGTVLATVAGTCYRLSRENVEALCTEVPKVKKLLQDAIAQYQVDEAFAAKLPRAEQPVPKQPPLQYETPAATPKTEATKPGDEPAIRPAKRFLKRPPFVRQFDETDCGAASLAMISQYYGIRLPMGRLRDIINVGREGASMFSLATGAERLGYRTRPLRLDYDQLVALDLPAIAHWKGYHYLVVYRAEPDKVLLGDPAVGIVTMSRKEFQAGWTGLTLGLTPEPRLMKNEAETTNFRRFMPMLLPYRRLLIEIFIASLVLNLFGMAFPLFTQTIVDKVLVQQDQGLLNLMLGGMIVVGVFQILTTVLRQYLLLHVSTKLSLTMSTQLFSKLFQLPMRYFHTRRIGDMLTRFQDNQVVRDMLTGATISTLLDVLMVGVYLVLMLLYNPKLTFFALLFVPLYILVTVLFTPILKRNNQAIFEKSAVAQSKLVESLKGVETIKAATAELPTRWAYEELLVQGALAHFQASRSEMVLSVISRSLQIASSTCLLWYGATLVLKHELSVGQLMAFQSLAGMTMAPIMGLVGMWQHLQEVVMSLTRLRDIYDADPEQSRTVSRVEMPALHGRIQFDKVSFRYNADDAYILKGISLEIQPGETIAIVGRSGAGKTTLISLLQRFYAPSTGTIRIDGHDLNSIDLAWLRSQTGVVLQQNTLFTGTIRENIALGDPGASIERIMHAAKLANAHDFIEAFPLGYDTTVGEVGVSLSGGQRQRLAIARALLNDPRILIFDEATSALDTESERAIQQNLQNILKGRTAIVIAHRLTTIQNADRIVVLDQGSVVETGTHAELMQRKGLYHYLNSQQLTM